jgi:putative transcriptional regulator
LNGCAWVTKARFAAHFGFWSATLRHRAQGNRSAKGSVLVPLNVIYRIPPAVILALR